MLHYRQRASQALRERLILLRQLTVLEVFVAVAIGVVGGLFPVPLVTSFVTLISGWYVQCNAAELVVGSTVNLFCTPLQFALIPYLARMMGAIMQEDTSTFTARALREAVGKGYIMFLKTCGWMIAYATLAWFFVFIPVILVLRAIQRCATHRAARRDSLRVEKAEVLHVREGH
jgi:Na+/phosphate symporter